MDVGSYFRNVLSTSYMVRVQFSGVDYEEVGKGGKRRAGGSGKGGSRKKKAGAGRYTSQIAETSVLEEGAIPNDSLERLLGGLSDSDRQKAARDGLQLLIARHILRSEGGFVDGTFTHEALLVIPANVNVENRTLTYPADWKGRAPWMPRPLLEEETAKGVVKADILIGSYADYEDYVSTELSARDRIDTFSAEEQWKAYVSYAEGLYERVYRCAAEELEERGLRVDDDATYLLIDTNVNASAPIEELYERIRTQGRGRSELNLFRSMTDLRQRDQVVACLDDDGVAQVLDHAGTASRDYPLARSQRLAVHCHGMLPEGEVLAVSGPPGTGKTTLLQSIVADLLVHRALEDKPKPPVIVGTSTNNQAVTNIVDAFTKDVKQQEGISVFRRWLPNIDFEENGKGCTVDEGAPLHSLGVYSPSASKKDEALKKGYLTDDLSRKSDGLYQRCINKRYSGTAPAVYCQQASAFLGTSFSKPGEALRAVQQRLRTIDDLRRRLVSLVDAHEGQGRVDESRCAEIIQQLAGYGALDAKGGAIPLEACQRLQDLDEALDITVRPLEFWLAIHVFEGMWLTARWLKNTEDEKQLSSYKLEHVDKYHSQMAALMPLTVMTMYRLPRQFICENADGECKQAIFGAIDLLIVDEAGQVDAAVGAAAFALAKRAVVVGDVFQLPPVWGLEPDPDFMIAQGFMDPREDQKAVWERLRARGLTASRNSSVMAVAQSACPWAYEASSGADSEGDFSFWDDEDEGADDGICGGLFLSEHRRCVNSIIEYCNELLYGGKLEAKRGDRQAAQIGLPPMGFCPVDGKAVPSGTSRKNLREAQVVAAWIAQNIERLWKAYDEVAKKNDPSKGADPKKVIGVVTPFAAQANEVKAQLRKLGSVVLEGKGHKLADIITVGTAHRLQGAECPVVLFSLVYDATSTASFVENNPNLMNVAVSRAKDAFIVFGNDSLMGSAGGNGVMGLLNYYCYDHKIEPPAVREAPAAKGSAGKKGKKKIEAKESGDGWAAQDGPLAMTKARKASIADGFWPSGWEGKTVSEINEKLAELGVIQNADSGFAPTPKWQVDGVESRGNDKGDIWCVYTEAAMRKIARLLA